MRLESAVLSRPSGGDGPPYVGFSFPLPPGVGSDAVPPRALLSLKGAGSMRYLAGERNPSRQGFFSALGIDFGRLVAIELRHTRRVRFVETDRLPPGVDGMERDALVLPGEDVGDGGPDGAEGCDGIVFLPPAGKPVDGGSNPPVATVTVADCMPLWLWDAVSGAWGLLHSGWKGTGILERAVRGIEARRSTRPASMAVILGPAIGVCCYDVPEPRADAFAREFGEECVDRSERLPRIDIRAANLAIARRLGIGAVLSVDACTHCDASLGSFRREGAAGFTRMVAACVPA